MKDKQFGSVDAYARAFRVLIAEGIPDYQIALLRAHFNSPDHTTTWAKLAQTVGYANGGGVHLQYGRLGRRLAEQLGKRLDFWTLILVDWAEMKDPSGHTAYILRPPVIKALTKLGVLATLSKPLSFEQAEAAFSKEIDASARLDPVQRRRRLLTAEKYPSRREAITTVFIRNADVVAEVIHRAKGLCEECKSPAPFKRASDGSPYLEVHHKIRLVDGGEDSIENAQALCPNCHRKAHYG